MSEPARNRFALDLEDLERQLRAAGQAPRPGQAADPLAELTRIVGQDDPLKDIFAPRGPVPVPAAPRPVQGHAVPVEPVRASPAQAAPEQDWPAPPREPSFEPAPAQEPAPVAPPAELRGALDEFEALLRRTEVQRPAPAAAVERRVAAAAPEQHEFARIEPEAYVQPAYAQPASVQGVAAAPRDLDEAAGGYVAPDYPYAYDQAQEPQYEPVAEDDLPELEPRRSRKGLWAAAALIAVGLGGAGAAMLLRGPSAPSDGQPPTIAADQGPTKVAPVNPGGADIPNQNKQIYDRAGEAPVGQTKVVSREEQPIDVQQAARSMPARVVLPGPGSAVAATEANPLAQAPAAPQPSLAPAEPVLTPVPPVPGLGEPRRVRTVSIRPDGSPAPAPVAAPAPDVPFATGSAPARANDSAATETERPISTALPQPRPTTPLKVQERVATPPAATTPVAPTRLASAAPEPAAPPPAPATAAVRAGSGDFTVQLAAPGSEAEARATFAALQRKYPSLLGGQAPIVRKTELAGGKTVYRLRVGPYSRESATTMCSQLQAAGGQCFIAKN